MLMLSMTDGVQDVKGMEHKPIRCLHDKLAPGVKVGVCVCVCVCVCGEREERE